MADNPFASNPYMPQDNSQQQGGGEQPTSSSSNPFAANPYMPQQAAQPDPADQGGFAAAVDGFNRQFGRLAEAGIKGFENATGLGDKQKLDAYITKQNLDQATSSMYHPYTSGAGSLLGGIGTGIYGILAATAAGSGAAAGLAAKVAGRALPTLLPESLPGMVGLNTVLGASMGAANEYGSPGSTNDSIGMSALKGGATAAAFTGAAGLLGPYIKPLVSGAGSAIGKVINPKGAALRDLTQQVADNGGRPAMMANGADAEALGVPQTPSEVMGNGLKGWEMQQLKSNPDNLVGDFANTRNEQIRRLANDTSNQFTPQGLEAAEAASNKSYEGLKNLEVPEEKILGSTKASNNLIQDQLKEMNDSRYSNMTDVPNGSVYKLDQLKQNIGDKIYQDQKYVGDPKFKLKSDELDTHKTAYNDINNVIDGHHPDTAGIRQDAQRIIFQKRINEQLDNFGPKQQDHGVPTLDAMYDKLWKGSKTEDFLSAVKESGGDVENAKKVINVMRDTYQNNVNQVTGNSTLTQANSAKSASKPGIVSNIIDHTVTKPYQKAMVQLLLSPDWKDQVSEALRAPTHTGVMTGLTNLVSKVVPKPLKSYINSQIKQEIGISPPPKSFIPGIAGGLVQGVANLPSAAAAAVPVAAGSLQSQGYPVTPAAYMLGSKLMHPLRTLGFSNKE